MECDGAPLTWLYGPLVVNGIKEHDQSRRLAGSDFNRGINLVDIFNPFRVYVCMPWGKSLEIVNSLVVKYTDESNPIVQSNHLIKESISRGIVRKVIWRKEIYKKNNRLWVR
jgi:hypothetical protein